MKLSYKFNQMFRSTLKIFLYWLLLPFFHFRYGLFQSKCKGYEVVLADASVVWCDKDNHPELYHAIPWSYGTFGFLTALDIELIPYKPYVKHTYIPVQSLKESVDIIETLSNDSSIDTVEGILYTRERGVVMKGVFVDESEVSC